MEDPDKHAQAFTDAVRKAFVKVYGRPADPAKLERSILSSYSEKGERLDWVSPDPDVVLVLTEFAWVPEPYSSGHDMEAWGKVTAELRKKGFKASWDSVNAGVQIVYLEQDQSSIRASMGASRRETPVALLRLDTRAHGPFVCTQCDEENEDGILMTDGRIVCPSCGTPMEDFEPLTDLIVSTAALKPGQVDTKKWHCCDDQCRSRGCRHQGG